MPQEKDKIPPVSMDSLFFMLATSALVNLGSIPNPVDQKISRNLDLAKYNIDLMLVLKEKTRGNLTAAEAKLLDELLHDLRLKYASETSRPVKQ